MTIYTFIIIGLEFVASLGIGFVLVDDDVHAGATETFVKGKIGGGAGG